MKIYYFGELIEDNGRKIEKQQQTALALETPQAEKTIFDTIGDLLGELDLSLDVYRPLSFFQ